MNEQPAFLKTVNRSEAFHIELPSNPTTGYRWEVSFEEEFIQFVDRRFQGTGGIGASGIEIFQFRAVKSGETRIRFQYKRAWEQEAIEQRVYSIISKPEKQ